MQSEIVVSVRRPHDLAAERVLEERLYAPISEEIYPVPTNPLQVRYVNHCSDCSGCSYQSASKVLEDVGNMGLRAMKYREFFYREGLASDCRHCTNWNLRMSEMLEYHARVLIARLRDDVKLVSSMASQRSRVLRELGYTNI